MSQIASNMEHISDYKKMQDIITPFCWSKSFLEKKTAMDFRIILMSIINKDNNVSLIYLHNGLKNVFNYFMMDFINFTEKKVDMETCGIISYDIIHDIAKIIVHQILHKDRLHETNIMFMNFKHNYDIRT